MAKLVKTAGLNDGTNKASGSPGDCIAFGLSKSRGEYSTGPTMTGIHAGPSLALCRAQGGSATLAPFAG